MEDFWIFEVSGDALRVKSRGPLVCPICGEELKPHHIGNVHPVLNGLAVDIHFKCPRCRFFCTFGIPVDEELGRRLMNFQGKFFEWWEEENNEEIKSRLQRLGYW